MKKMLPPLAALAMLPLSVWGASSEDAKLQIYPKNLARHHMGANVFEYNEANHTYVPASIAATWMDDDIATGAAPETGRKYYLITLGEPQTVENFEISAGRLEGTFSVYTADEPAAPGTPAWKPLVSKKPIDSIVDHKLGSPLSRITRYILLETDLTEVSPIYSLYVYGEKPAVAYKTNERSSTVDVGAVLGKSVDSDKSISAAGLYTGARVTDANAQGDKVSWQRAIDDNPETAISLKAGDSPAALVRMEEDQMVHRFSVLTDGEKGKLEFFLANDVKGATSEGVKDKFFLKSPIATIEFDGHSTRGSANFAPVGGQTIAVRWTPAEGGSQTVTLHELNAFTGITLANHEVAALETVAENSNDPSKDSFKNVASSSKEALPPVAELAPERGPYMPGALPPPTDFQTTLLNPTPTPTPTPTPVLPPDEPLSP